MTDMVDLYSPFEERSTLETLDVLSDASVSITGTVDHDVYGAGKGLREFEAQVARIVAKETGK